MGSFRLPSWGARGRALVVVGSRRKWRARMGRCVPHWVGAEHVSIVCPSALPAIHLADAISDVPCAGPGRPLLLGAELPRPLPTGAKF